MSFVCQPHLNLPLDILYWLPETDDQRLTVLCAIKYQLSSLRLLKRGKVCPRVSTCLFPEGVWKSWRAQVKFKPSLNHRARKALGEGMTNCTTEV